MSDTAPKLSDIKSSTLTPPSQANPQEPSSPITSQQPPSPSLEQKITALENQGPITTLINEQLASRIEQKIEQKLDYELQQTRKPDTIKWLMLAFGIGLLTTWLAWTANFVYHKWF